MISRKVHVNKTAEQPEGVEIEIIIPESSLEQRTLSFLLVGTLREIRRAGQMGYELPENFNVEHTNEGTFVVTTVPGPNAQGYYEPARAVSILGIRVAGNGFDLVHAEVKQPVGAPSAEAPKA
jgi:hypothetical protein